MVRRAVAALVVTLVASSTVFAGCRDSLAPGLTGSPDPLLNASWMTGANPGGSFTALKLRAAGGRILGAGSENRFCCFYDSLAVTGHYEYGANALSLSLTIAYKRGASATFVGTAVDMDSLFGTWAGGEPFGPFPRTFYRRGTLD